MSDSIADRANRLLEDAEDAIDGLGSIEEGEDLPGELEDSGLAEAAEDASGLIEDEDADELLEALGLDELEDGTEPGSLLETIAQGNEEQVGDLRVLVKLAKVADADDEELPTEVGELREAVSERAGVLGGGESETDEEDDADGDDADGESLAESATDAVQDAVGSEEGDGDDEGFIEEEIESAMRSKLEGFGEELDEARAHLDSLREEERGDADEEDDTDDEREGEDADADDGPLGSDSRPRSRGTMHSTMAPSPSKRADMGRSTRHSTMPDR